MNERTVKLTKIEKKNKKTGNTTVINYAKVNDRLITFRADFPNSKILTRNSLAEDGTTEFTAYIWRDRKDYISGDMDSADANGTARGSIDGEKNFEKLETIAVGRALALLGYSASGEIASFEEMQEFHAHKESVRKEYVELQVGLLENAKTMDVLRDLWSKTDKTEPAIVAAKDKRKTELEKPPVSLVKKK